MTALPIKLLLAVDKDLDREHIEHLLTQEGGVELVGVVDDLDSVWAALDATNAELLVVASPSSSDRALFFIDQAVRQNPERPVVVLADNLTDGYLRRVFEAGAEDAISLSAEPEEIGFSLQKVLARRQGATTGGGTTAPLICVLGPKGGTGKTLVSTNLAVALAMRGEKVVLVDLDLQFGDLGLALGIAPDRTVYDLVKAGGSLDAEKLDGFLMTHASSARVLIAPTRPDQASVVTVEFLREVYGVLRTMADFVIVDTPPGFTPEVIASIDISTEVIMVGMLDSLSLKNTKLGLETLELMGYQSEAVTLVLNRADSRVGITDDDVAAIVGRAPQIRVPSDRAIPRSVNEGAPIVLSQPRTEAARAFRQLAALVAPERAAAVKRPQQGGLMRMLLGRR
ncbi:MAG: pilus assembly protein CpaE [Frankiaceae bacterium]|nr:pilus assembly protein CpaE [Frankiaceae bacterium]